MQTGKLTFASDISSQVIKVDMSPSTRTIIHKPYKPGPTNICPYIPSSARHGFTTTSCQPGKSISELSFASTSKRVFGRNHAHSNLFPLQVHFYANQTPFHLKGYAGGVVNASFIYEFFKDMQLFWYILPPLLIRTQIVIKLSALDRQATLPFIQRQ